MSLPANIPAAVLETIVTGLAALNIRAPSRNVPDECQIARAMQ